MIRKIKPKGIEDKVIEVSFSPNKEVKLKVGDSVTLRPTTVVDIDGKREYVFQADNNLYSTFSYEGRNIVFKRRHLKYGIIVDFNNVASVEKYYPGSSQYRSIKKILTESKIYPEDI